MEYHWIKPETGALSTCRRRIVLKKDAMDSMKPQLKRRRSYAGHRHHRTTDMPHGFNREARNRKTKAGRSEA
jgi:hypothetical protein